MYAGVTILSVWAVAAVVLLPGEEDAVESRAAAMHEAVASHSSAALPPNDVNSVFRMSVTAGLHRLLLEELALHGIDPEGVDAVILMAYSECMVDRFFDSASVETLSAIAAGHSGADIGDHDLLEAASSACTSILESTR